FPIETLRPRWLQKWVTRAARGAGTTVDHVAVPLLGIASGLIGTKRRIEAATSWTEPATCWTGIVGFSGEGKTPGLRAVKRPLDEFEYDHKSEIDAHRREHETRVEQAKAAKAQWKKEFDEAVAKGESPPPKPAEADDPEPFIAPSLYASDTTIEKMA